MAKSEIEPFAFGDEINGDWTRYRICPVCGDDYVITCKCACGDSQCSNGHGWHKEDGKVVEGRA